MTDQIKEAIKEGLRVVVIATIPSLIIMLESGSVDVRSIAIVAIVAGLRALDKFLHEMGKSYGDEEWMKGLTRF